MRQQLWLHLPVAAARRGAGGAARRAGRGAPRAAGGGPDRPGRGQARRPRPATGPAQAGAAAPVQEEPTRRGPPGSIDEDLRWTAATPARPCPVCGAEAGCGVAAEEGFAACERVPSEHPLDVGGWLHRLPRPAAG